MGNPQLGWMLPTLGTPEEGHRGTCVTGVGTESQWDLLTQSCRYKFSGGKISLIFVLCCSPSFMVLPKQHGWEVTCSSDDDDLQRLFLGQDVQAKSSACTCTAVL